MKRTIYKYALLIAASMCFTFAVCSQDTYSYASKPDSLVWINDSTVVIKPPLQYGDKWSSCPETDEHRTISWTENVSYVGGDHRGVSFCASQGTIAARSDADRDHDGYLRLENDQGVQKKVYTRVRDTLPTEYIPSGKVGFGKEIDQDKQDAVQACVTGRGSWIGGECVYPDNEAQGAPAETQGPFITFNDSTLTYKEYLYVPDTPVNVEVYNLLGRHVATYYNVNPENINTLQLNGLPTGAYFARVPSLDGKYITLKLYR